MRKSLLLIATFICCSLFANAQWTTVVNDTMYSKVLKAERGYTIVLPAINIITPKTITQNKNRSTKQLGSGFYFYKLILFMYNS